MAKRLEIMAISLFALTLGVFFSMHAQAQDARIAIIDSSENTKPHIAKLHELGVLAIGRYYGRCRQWRGKRMIDNLDEINAILDGGRLGILSVYQFHSQEEKFDNDRSSLGVKSVDIRPRMADPKTVKDFNDCISPARPNTIEEDARLDGYAAVTQAREIIKQPAGTAIYFGVDFNLTPDRQANVLKYFRIVNKMVTDAGYVTGVYGNGAISDLLYGENPAGEKLVKYVWLTASSSHEGSANTYNVKHWDLLQTKVNISWSVAGQQVPLDTNMQNPNTTDAGFWNRSGSFVIPNARNVAVHGPRRFVCEGRPVVFNDAGQSVPKPACTTTFGITVRTFEMNTPRTLVRVDCDEDGNPDGWMKVKDLSAKRPIWVNNSERPRTHCTQ
ncbi:glycoside hydrolase domain-containing protein [Bradyrhizobium sp.]|jgi:hypothetical protein|uniref:glycoside hydrolase domain-containing protein n=1 Tax=Bradyrhizobium sp. TaxID=376 RepID=UPI002DFA6E3E|nr:glycoside hydrolase domain-containing protein [Bradyrhizobium sp.]